MTGLIYLAAFVVAILILVSLHELGHYVVARLCGVKVVRFSVGFGKPFFIKKRGDTEWCLAPIPLGGYVKMVDTREGEVAEKDLPYAFDKQTPLKRMAIVVAGPLVNLLLAVLLYAASFSIFGVTEVKPWVGTVAHNTLAERAGFEVGDQIQSVNGKAVAEWMDAQTEMTLGLQAGNVLVTVKDAQGQAQTRTIVAQGEPEAVEQAAQGQGIGLMPMKISSAIGQVVDGSPAQAAGLQAGDIVTHVDGQAIANWNAWVAVIQNSPGKNLLLDVNRQGQNVQLSLRPNSEDTGSRLVGKAGVAPSMDQAWTEQVRVKREVGVLEGIDLAATRTWDYSILTLKFFGKMLIGEASIKSISGPVTIGEIAGKSAMMGWEAYIQFLAIISISLGVMNLLPIPVLDGGHLVYYFIEWVRGKPLSQYVQLMGLKIGLCIMGLFMLVAFFNDFTRIFG
ncbi:putative zinc metalloprotease [Vitreoscilla sp. C1]|uniref:RIP metalloprotease RseP n=1 Tax=Vitreoscilla sp. (strain C1) TaxID=96942 RepID=UPI00159A0280|nr:putative zinc metalloprotease [Vitreoscilla sp. C1]